MVAFLKVYQEQWVVEIANRVNDTTLTEVCQKIVGDDTGGTDELSQLLAKEILNLTEIIRG